MKGGKGNPMLAMMMNMMGGGGMGRHMVRVKDKSDIKVGDWWCPKCKDRQFAKNETCRKCKEPKPTDEDAFYKGKAGDWKCPACGDHQFARNNKCRKCDAPKPAEGDDAFIKCAWCEKGECWDHGQVDKPKKKKW
eukprot:gnl/MRDRNA2_/MRDRNA2_192045_c0_seq1.p1 gnl/MRDRNA2_/MRDRNA2_192045_c0~~gnl/MRDRNA2_/MRDRNA2_192045_c0_seq1.p1  ORF type:complete len:135 (+),score=38.54 gnl/MRDRNA2_/MRDRNA2_192045_c0_seq1:91-495(+)